MALSDKIYMLRKQSGLSQEQLAEQLNISRQAISKWESGASSPESEKLIALSNFFNVSLDDLMKENSEPTMRAAQRDKVQTAERVQRSVGLVICIGGIICLIVWGLLSVLSPAASGQLRASSVITIDGNGVFLTICVVSIAVGAVLLLKDSGEK